MPTDTQFIEFVPLLSPVTIILITDTAEILSGEKNKIMFFFHVPKNQGFLYTFNTIFNDIKLGLQNYSKDMCMIHITFQHTLSNFNYTNSKKTNTLIYNKRTQRTQFCFEYKDEKSFKKFLGPDSLMDKHTNACCQKLNLLGGSNDYIKFTDESKV